MAGLRPPFVTVVAGVPRSGTSLMMQMLRAGGLELLTDGEREADPHNPRGYFEYEPVRRTRRDSSWVEDAAGRVVKVVHVLVAALPDHRVYRVILMRRNLSEVVASQRAMLEGRGSAEELLSEDRLIAIFRAQLDQLERWAADQRHLSLLAVDYSDLLADPWPVAEAVNRFLGGGLDCASMVAVVDPALHRHRALPGRDGR